MIVTPLRRLALTSALVVLALAASAGSAHAAISASTISSPVANSYFYYDFNAPSSTMFTVAGTTTGTGNVDIDCYEAGGSRELIVANVTVTNNAFSVPITSAEIGTSIGDGACVLRAVDTGDVQTTPYVPGASTSFSGPNVAVSEKEVHSSGSTAYDFDYYLDDFSGFMDLESAGDCGLSYGELIAASTLTYSPRSFDCLGAIFDTYPSQSGPTIGPELTVDGTRAVDTDSAYYEAGYVTTLPGFQGLTVTDSYTAGALTVHDSEPLLFCSPDCSAPTSFSPSGVELDRTWQTTADGLVALQSDVFRSVDGAQHTLGVLEDQEIGRQTGIHTAINFPGSSGFQDYSDTATLTLPAGPGVIYFKTNGAEADAGNGVDPQGAIVYAGSPNGPVAFTYSDEVSSGSSPDWVMPYTRTIPAGGSAAPLRFAYIQSYSLGQAQSLAQTALASFAPAVSISSPGNGATVTTSSVAVSGAVTDAVGITSVKVNGVVATLAAGGTFAATVPLTLGANTITAVATDGDGITGQQAITVTYKVPPAVTTGKASKVTSTTAKIAGTVNPEGQATTYEVEYGTTTSYASHTAAVSAGAGNAAVAAALTLKKLKASTTYHYRVIATNASGTSPGADAKFKTGKPAPKGLGAKASPKSASTFPYRYTVKGKLSLPAGITANKGCSGKITIKVKRGKKIVLTTRATITKKCTWKATVTATKHSKVPGHGKLQITASFGGNKALAALTAKPLTVHYG
ncbi:MAG TPA: Ig-like domain-containing protein [Solirubrobacteraceae bacterium]|nr:Ig-like domain-containing protein [Solirubrobacteraceae bacterium]